MSSRKKVSIIGAGYVGSTTAMMLAQKEICDIVLIDVVEGIAKGKALDIQESSPLLGFDSQISGSTDYSEIKDSEIVIITAGVARKPGMSREDLFEINSKIMGSVALEVKRYSPGAIIIVISNPLDAMVYVAKSVSGFEKNRVMGMAGILDSARFKTFISLKTGFSVENIDAIMLGGHGDDMVPLSRLAHINGIPIKEFLSESQIEEIEKRTRRGGSEIVDLLKTGSAYFAASAAICDMVLSIILDKKKIMPVSAYLEGEYGYKGIFIGVPALLGRNGVEKIVEISLTDSERKALDETAKRIEAIIGSLKEDGK